MQHFKIVDITKCKASASNALRKLKKTPEETAEIAKSDVKKSMEESPYPCIIQFDNNTFFEMNQGKRMKGSSVFFPDSFQTVFVNIEGELHLLGVPVLQSSSGENLYLGILKILEEYNLISKICGA